MATLVERAMGAARLDAATYEEVEHDPAALTQALTVVVIASVAAAIGSVGTAGDFSVAGLVLGAVASLIGWLAWATITWLVGTRVLPTPQTEADIGQLLRTTGFSAAPGVIAILGVVPVLGALAIVVASLWQLAAMVVAVRQALDYTSTGRAIGVCLIGFAVYLAIWIVIGGMLIATGVGNGPATHPG